MAQPQGQETAEPHVAAPVPGENQMLTADINDNDSAIGDEPDLESTASISSSIYKFRIENGRTYNAYGDRTYVMPNDEIEKDRLDLQHHLFQLTFDGKLFTSDIDKSKVNRVLDIGTGTGIWAIDYASEHPEAEVIGVDVSPIQPNFVPPNVQFEIDDMEKEWTFTKNFDFIYSRMMTGAISNWVAYIERCFANTNPGGYLEIVDITQPPDYIDDSGKGTALTQWGELMLEASFKLSIPLNSVKGVKKIMEDAGYVDVVEKKYKWPMNKWPAEKKMKEIGMWAHEASVSNLSGMSTALYTRGLGWSAEEVEVFLAGVRNDMKNLKIHSFWSIYVITGRKPEAPATKSEEEA